MQYVMSVSVDNLCTFIYGINMSSIVMYTPEQVANILQVNKSTVYNLIKNGGIIAKKIGKIYGISANSLSFAFTGLDYDLLLAEREDMKNVKIVEDNLVKVRKEN